MLGTEHQRGWGTPTEYHHDEPLILKNREAQSPRWPSKKKIFFYTRKRERQYYLPLSFLATTAIFLKNVSPWPTLW